MPVKLVAIDGPPGVGKTTRILARAEAGELEAVLTFGKDAAAVIHDRAPGVVAGTIFSLTWAAGANATSRRSSGDRRSAPAYLERPIWGATDPALDLYTRDAPSLSRLPPHLQDKLDAVSAWDGEGTPPVDLNDKEACLNSRMKYDYALARWLHAGAPWKDEFKGYSAVALDEAQDFTMLQMAAALRLLRPGGVAWAYGDPGQAVRLRLEGGELPPVWMRADEKQLLSGGHRCGFPAAELAARALAPYWDRPAETFAAEHETEILPWDLKRQPDQGLVLAYSRRLLEKTLKEWGLRETWVTPNKCCPQDNLVMCTIHAAKGSEADSVYVLPSKSLCDRIAARDSGALRVIYVAITRARRRIFLPTSMKALLPK